MSFEKLDCSHLVLLPHLYAYCIDVFFLTVHAAAAVDLTKTKCDVLRK
jgi:hypothetical protein